MLFQLFLILVLAYIFYRRSNSRLFCDPEKPVRISTYPAIELVKGSFKVIRVQGLDFVRRVFNLLSGKQTAKNLQDFENKLFIDGQDIVNLTGKQDFLYVCS